jgi:hypothetical protein
LISVKTNTGENSDPNDPDKWKQKLLEENRRLQEKIAKMEAELQSRKEREQTLSAAIKLGFWEWDEINNRPNYLSKEYYTNYTNAKKIYTTSFIRKISRITSTM